MRCRACLVLLAPLLAVGCDAGIDVSAEPSLASNAAPLAAAPATPPPGSTGRLGRASYVDRAAGCRFSYPAGLHAVTDHFDAALPPYKIRHAVTLSNAEGPVLRVDVWVDAEGLGLQPWFDKYLSFTLADGVVATPLRVGPAAVPAIVVDRPREQAPAQRIVALAQNDRIFRITSVDSDEPSSRDALHEVLDSFDAEVGR